MRAKELAESRVRYGYRRLHSLLQRDGWRDSGMHAGIFAASKGVFETGLWRENAISRIPRGKATVMDTAHCLASSHRTPGDLMFTWQIE